MPGQILKALSGAWSLQGERMIKEGKEVLQGHREWDGVVGRLRYWSFSNPGIQPWT